MNFTLRACIAVFFLGLLFICFRHPTYSKKESVEVFVNHYSKLRRNNVLRIEDTYCDYPSVISITVMCAGESCFMPDEFKCPKTRVLKVSRNLFHRFQECSDAKSVILSNDDDILLNEWALETMLAYYERTPDAIVGPYGRKVDHGSYTNPWHSIQENVALTNVALVPCNIIPLWRKWKNAEEYISTAKGGCEDILLNMLSNKVSSPAIIEPKWEMIRTIDTKLEDNSGGLHGKSKDHWDEYRDECVLWGMLNLKPFLRDVFYSIH